MSLVPTNVKDNALVPTARPLGVPKPTVAAPKVAGPVKITPVSAPTATVSKEQALVNLNKGPGTAAEKALAAKSLDQYYPSPTTTQSLTTLSSDKSTDIATNNTRLEAVSNKGVTTDSKTGISTDASGKVYNADDGNVSEVEADTSSEDAATAKLLRKMQESLDSSTNSLISNIQQKFDQRRSEQRDINSTQEKGVTNALLMGGVTGAGSAAQYAPISSTGIITAQESYGLKQIAELDAQENDLIVAAKEAQRTGQFKIMEKMLADIEVKRKEKVDAAIALNKDIAARNNKIREQNIQSSRDGAIANLFSQGVTDVSTMLNYLNYDEKGNKIGDFTAKEISDSLKNIVPPGLDDLVKTLRTNGAPQEVISKVISSPNMTAAYEAAGGYGAGGTGIIGEYNFYRAQALANGQQPVDFDTYQNMDANRKKSIAAAGALSTVVTNTALKLSDDYEARSKDYYQQREAYNRIVSSASDPSAAGDLALIFNYMKVLDPGSTVREGEFANAQNAGSAWNIIGAKYNKVVEGERLTETQRKDFVDRAKKLFSGAKAQQDSVADEFKARAAKYGVPADLVVRDTEATGNGIIKTEEQAKTDVVAAGVNNPDLRGAITQMVADNVPYLQIKETLGL